MTAGATNVGTTDGVQSDYKHVFNQLSHMAALSRTAMAEHVAQSLVDRSRVLGRDSTLSSAEDIKKWDPGHLPRDRFGG
jgi:ATP-dependent protease ClpP protease subunit